MIAPRIRPASASLCVAGLLNAGFLLKQLLFYNALFLLNSKEIELYQCTGATCTSLFR
jgi:hypothetical protein